MQHSSLPSGLKRVITAAAFDSCAKRNKQIKREASMSAFVQINKLWFKYCFDLKYDNDYNINGNKIQTDLKTNNLPKIFKH